MRTIRRGVFETNSSAVHSLTICSKEEYEKWEKGELLYNDYKKKFITKKEAAELLGEEITEESLLEEEIYSSPKELGNYLYKERGFDSFEEKHITKSGDEIVIFGYYGHDG